MIDFPFLTATQTTASNEISFWKLATSIGIFLAGQFLWRLLTDYWRRASLRTALMTDCIITLNKMREHRKKLISYRERCTKDRVLENPSGFLISGPLKESTDFYELLTPWNVQRSVHYFDRWQRFVETERRYGVVFEKIVFELKEASAASESQPFSGLALQEYINQSRGMLDGLAVAASELCYLSCSLFRELCPQYSYSYIRYSHGRWAGPLDLIREMKEYESEISADTKSVENFAVKPSHTAILPMASGPV